MNIILDYLFDTKVLFTICLAVIYAFSTWTFDHWKKRKIPFMTPVPYFGNFTKFAISWEPVTDTFDRIYKAFPEEPVVGFFQLREPVLLVRDPKVINEITVKSFDHFTDRGISKGFINADKDLNPLSGHLFSLEGERWKALRAKLSPTFTTGKMKHMTNQIEECLEGWLPLVENATNESNGINVRELSVTLTIDVIGACAFGLDLGAIKDPNSKFRDIGVRVFKPTWKNFARIILNSINTGLLKFFHLTDFPEDITDFYKDSVKETINYRKKNGVSRPDFLQMLMELQNDTYSPGKPTNDDTFDDLDVASNAFLFMAAGFETTASTLSYTLYELALNPDVQDKLFDEVQRVLNNCDEKLTLEAMKELQYMDMVIAETLRKYPPVNMLNRICTETHKITNTDITITKGTMIVIPIYSIHHDKDHFPEPEKYVPERFSEENRKNRPNGIYLPFGDGPRYCIGTRFAKMELKMALTEIVKKYSFSTCKRTKAPLKFTPGSPLLTPVGGLFLNINKR